MLSCLRSASSAKVQAYSMLCSLTSAPCFHYSDENCIFQYHCLSCIRVCTDSLLSCKDMPLS